MKDSQFVIWGFLGQPVFLKTALYLYGLMKNQSRQWSIETKGENEMEWAVKEIRDGEWAVMRGEEIMVTLRDKELAEEIVGRINVAGLDHPVDQEITR